jgi:hypothetical protein
MGGGLRFHEWLQVDIVLRAAERPGTGLCEKYTSRKRVSVVFYSIGHEIDRQLLDLAVEPRRDGATRQDAWL